MLVECTSSKVAEEMVRDLNSQYQLDTEVRDHGDMNMEELQSAAKMWC